MYDHCPYCGVGVEINHDDGYGYDEDQTYQQECHNCEKTFVYQTSISIDHELFEAPCLNGGKHDFYITKTFPPEYKKKKCKICDEQFPITEEERNTGIANVQ